MIVTCQTHLQAATAHAKAHTVQVDVVRFSSDRASAIDISEECFYEWAGCVFVLKDW